MSYSNYEIRRLNSEISANLLHDEEEIQRNLPFPALREICQHEVARHQSRLELVRQHLLEHVQGSFALSRAH